MRHSDGRIRRVDMLAPGASGSIGIDSQILVLDNNVDLVVNFRVDKHRSKGSVPSFVGIERRNADQTVNTDLCS